MRRGVGLIGVALLLVLLRLCWYGSAVAELRHVRAGDVDLVAAGTRRAPLREVEHADRRQTHVAVAVVVRRTLLLVLLQRPACGLRDRRRRDLHGALRDGVVAVDDAGAAGRDVALEPFRGLAEPPPDGCAVLRDPAAAHVGLVAQAPPAAPRRVDGVELARRGRQGVDCPAAAAPLGALLRLEVETAREGHVLRRDGADLVDLRHEDAEHVVGTARVELRLLLFEPGHDFGTVPLHHGGVDVHGGTVRAVGAVAAAGGHERLAHLQRAVLVLVVVAARRVLAPRLLVLVVVAVLRLADPDAATAVGEFPYLLGRVRNLEHRFGLRIGDGEGGLRGCCCVATTTFCVATVVGVVGVQLRGRVLGRRDVCPAHVVAVGIVRGTGPGVGELLLLLLVMEGNVRGLHRFLLYICCDVREVVKKRLCGLNKVQKL
eukprot:PhM_4_TR15682/c1_g1_i1/m.98055